jgi:hypothetical protein
MSKAVRVIVTHHGHTPAVDGRFVLSGKQDDMASIGDDAEPIPIQAMTVEQ